MSYIVRIPEGGRTNSKTRRLGNYKRIVQTTNDLMFRYLFTFFFQTSLSRVMLVRFTVPNYLELRNFVLFQIHEFMNTCINALIPLSMH